MTKTKAIETLKKTGEVEFMNAEIWETQKNGEYTGKYRVAPKGERELHDAVSDDSLSLTKAFALAENLGK